MAKYTPDFTITVLSASLYQYDNTTTQAPVTLGPFGAINLRRKCVPYLAGSLTATDRGMRSVCDPPPPVISDLPLLAPGGGLYGPTLTYDQLTDLPLMSPGGQLYNPTLIYDQLTDLPLMTPGGQLYNPTMGVNIPMPLQAPGGQLYNPSMGLSIPMPLQAPGGQLYNPTFSYSIPMPLQAPGGTLYDPILSLTIPMPLQAPGGSLYNPTVALLDVIITLDLLSPGGQAYSPDVCDSTFYVDGIGGQPYYYDTIQEAIDDIPHGIALSCSYIINVSGTHTYYEDFSPAGNPILITNITSSTRHTITLKAWTGTTDGSLPIVNASANVVAGTGPVAFYIPDVDNITIEGIRIENWSAQGTPNTASSSPGWAAIYLGQFQAGNGVNNITIKDCFFEADAWGKYGIYMAETATGYHGNITITGSEFSGSDSNIYDGFKAVTMYDVTSSTVQECTIYGWLSGAVEIYGDGTSISSGISLKQNTIHDCQRTVFYVDQQQETQFINNLIYDCGAAGTVPVIHLKDDVGGTNFYYNTLSCSATTTNDLIYFNTTGLSSPIRFYNNIYRFEGSDKPIYHFEDGAVIFATNGLYSDYNLFSLAVPLGDSIALCDNCGGGGGSATYSDLLAWRTYSGLDSNSTSSAGTPPETQIFTDGINKDFTLIATSDAVESGTPIAGITTDIINETRNVTTPSMGCYEFIPTFIYTAIVPFSNPYNTTRMHVGSVYLDARIYSTIAALITDIGAGGERVYIEFERFTDGSSLTTLENGDTTGVTWRSATETNVTVTYSDWYDIFISSSGNPATSSIRGLYYQY